MKPSVTIEWCLVFIGVFAYYEGHFLLMQAIIGIAFCSSLYKMIVDTNSKIVITLFTATLVVAYWETVPVVFTLLTTRLT